MESQYFAKEYLHSTCDVHFDTASTKLILNCSVLEISVLCVFTRKLLEMSVLNPSQLKFVVSSVIFHFVFYSCLLYDY